MNLLKLKNNNNWRKFFQDCIYLPPLILELRAVRVGCSRSESKPGVLSRLPGQGPCCQESCLTASEWGEQGRADDGVQHQHRTPDRQLGLQGMGWVPGQARELVRRPESASRWTGTWLGVHTAATQVGQIPRAESLSLGAPKRRGSRHWCFSQLFCKQLQGQLRYLRPATCIV